jgi:hypothetical protein
MLLIPAIQDLYCLDIPPEFAELFISISFKRKQRARKVTIGFMPSSLSLFSNGPGAPNNNIIHEKFRADHG